MVSFNKLTLQDCEKIVENSTEEKCSKISNWCCEPLSKDINGYLGEHNILIVNWVNLNNEQKQTKYFLKIVKYTTEAMEKSKTDSNNIFYKEQFFYETFIKSLEEMCKHKFDFLPKCYYQKDELFVLEYLPKEDYKIAQKPFQDNHVCLMMDCLAKFHSTTIIYEHYKSKDLKKKYCVLDEYADVLKEHLILKNDDNWGSKYVQSGVQGTKTLLDVYEPKKLNIGEMKSKFDTLVADFYSKANDANKYTKVISHGDLWYKNVLFKHVKNIPESCIIFDFQLIRYMPPAHDLTYSILPNNANLTKENINLYLQCYHAKLAEYLSKYNIDIDDVLSKNELLQTFEEYSNSALMLNMILSNLTLRFEDFKSDLCKNQEEHNKYIFGDRRALVLDLYKTNEIYRRHANSHLLDLENICLKM